MARSTWLTTSAVALLWAGGAQAQPSSSAQGAAQDEVVAAERRTSKLQTTDVAATMPSGQDFENTGGASLDQLQFAAPSTTVQNAGLRHAGPPRQYGLILTRTF